VRTATALRRAVLAVTLLDTGSLADIEVRDAGVLLPRPGCRPLVVPWDDIACAAGQRPTQRPEAEIRRRVARWLRLRLAVDELLSVESLDRPGSDRVLALVRPRALPVAHAVHPGSSWPRRRVLGGALDVGLAMRGYDDDGRPDPQGVGPLPAGVLVAAGVDVAEATDRAERYLEDMAEFASERRRRDPLALLRPLGDADVVTLLASPRFRAAVVDGQGMRSAAIPTLRRGWLDLGRLDPAFAPAAAALTDADQRGFPRPVLLTADEVTLVRDGGDVVRQSLSDPAPAEWHRPASRGV
jgi:hypothetical protein